MTTISAGAAAGLLVALMVLATSDSRGSEILSVPNDGDQLQQDASIHPERTGQQPRPVQPSADPKA